MCWGRGAPGDGGHARAARYANAIVVDSVAMARAGAGKKTGDAHELPEASVVADVRDDICAFLFVAAGGGGPTAEGADVQGSPASLQLRHAPSARPVRPMKAGVSGKASGSWCSTLPVCRSVAQSSRRNWGQDVDVAWTFRPPEPRQLMANVAPDHCCRRSPSMVMSGSYAVLRWHVVHSRGREKPRAASSLGRATTVVAAVPTPPRSRTQTDWGAQGYLGEPSYLLSPSAGGSVGQRCPAGRPPPLTRDARGECAGLGQCTAESGPPLLHVMLRPLRCPPVVSAVVGLQGATKG